MVPIISLLCVVSLSILITRVASVALAHTGLSAESARFQARSAFTGSGFTTNESERVVNHPVRRRIVMLLMLLGNAGIVSAISALILGFVRSPEGESITVKVVVLVAGVVALWGIASSRWVDRKLSDFISRMLKQYTNLNIRDYASLLRLSGDYRIVEQQVESADWIAGKKLVDTRLRDEGIVVLGIQKGKGDYQGTPDGEALIETGDILVLYGRTQSLKELDERRRGTRGDRKHQRAVEEQEQVEQEEEIKVAEKRENAD